MKKRIKKYGFFTLYKTQDDKLVSYGRHSSPPFISKLEKLQIKDQNLIKNNTSYVEKDFYFDKFSKP